MLPLAIGVWFNPKIIKRQVLPPIRLVLTLLFAEVKTAPGVTETVLKEGGSVKSNWTLVTELVLVLKEIGKSTAVPANPETVPPVNVGRAQADAVERRRATAEERTME